MSPRLAGGGKRAPRRRCPGASVSVRDRARGSKSTTQTVRKAKVKFGLPLLRPASHVQLTAPKSCVLETGLVAEVRCGKTVKVALSAEAVVPEVAVKEDELDFDSGASIPWWLNPDNQQ